MSDLKKIERAVIDTVLDDVENRKGIREEFGLDDKWYEEFFTSNEGSKEIIHDFVEWLLMDLATSEDTDDMISKFAKIFGEDSFLAKAVRESF